MNDTSHDESFGREFKGMFGNPSLQSLNATSVRQSPKLPSEFDLSMAAQLAQNQKLAIGKVVNFDQQSRSIQIQKKNASKEKSQTLRKKMTSLEKEMGPIRESNPQMMLNSQPSRRLSVSSHLKLAHKQSNFLD